MSSPQRVNAGSLARIGVACALWGLVVWQADWRELSVSVGEMDLRWALPGILLPGISHLAVGLRWWLLLRERGWAIPCADVLRWNFLGVFFNNFSLGSGGGDAAKIYQTYRSGSATIASAVGVLALDRMVGLFALCLLAVPFVWAARWDAQIAQARLVHWTVVGFAVAVFVLTAVHRRALRGRRRVFGRRVLLRLERVLALRRYSGTTLLAAIGLSWVGQCAGILGTYCLACGLGFERAGIIEFFCVVPVVWMATSVPIAPGAAGILEAGFWWFHETLQCTPSQTLALALAVRVTNLVWGVPGGLVMVSGSLQSTAVSVSESDSHAASPAPAGSKVP